MKQQQTIHPQKKSMLGYITIKVINPLNNMVMDVPILNTVALCHNLMNGQSVEIFKAHEYKVYSEVDEQVTLSLINDAVFNAAKSN